VGERVIGIDLGTTNSALAWADARGPVRVFDVPQLVAASETERRATLPSFLYFPTDAERSAGAVRLPWNATPDVVAGVFARDQGALVPGRQISSAKSWLSNALVDRTVPLLPWGADSGRRLSPVDASAALLSHLSEAWNAEHERDADSAPLTALPIVLTLPASFDEEARELTVEAARRAGFERLTLLEEPLAALYAWIAANRRTMADTFQTGALILICDVGGGTTDFSLIRVDVEGGELAFERIAIGEHLLLGGDNLDLTLAVLVEQKFGGVKLSLAQRQILRRKCSAAKELLLAEGAVDRVAITILGGGRSVVGGGLTADLTRDEVVRALTDGFLPLTAPDDLPARDRRTGLRELGLPYETEPALTKHLAGFLTRAARNSSQAGLARPDAILFNGGFFTPAIARERVLGALTTWFGAAPAVLENDRPESAVAIGAAFYARLRQNPDASRRLLVRAGTARAYYIGVGSDDGDETKAVCVMPRGTQEGTEIALDREFTVETNRPAAFTLYSATEGNDAVGAVVTLRSGRNARRYVAGEGASEHELHRHAPLMTALRFGRRSQRVPLPVRLTVSFTETGTLELWCESRTTEHRWRLAFNLRSVEADPLDEAVPHTDDERPDTSIVVSPEATVAAERLIRRTFAPDDDPLAPSALLGELENALGHGKHAWPLKTIRRLADVFLELAGGRARSAAHEVRWLNLAGFCIRPGFGSPLDDWRVSELRKVYLAGLFFPKEVQCQVEWLVLWQRTSAGFTSGQQRELAQRVSGQLGAERKARLNRQIEREGWRLLGGLERVDAVQRARFGDELLERIRREPRNGAWLWTLGRLGARTPLYGPLNSVVPPSVAERWIGSLLGLKQVSEDVVSAIVQIGARSDDPARDVSPELVDTVIERLVGLGFDPQTLEPLRVRVPPDPAASAREFGESLPEGLRLG
jgi:molecular chaperone DnaK (HSP70)